MGAADDQQEGPVDGRTARRDRNRVAVLDAVLALFAEGDLDPAATEVAERSGVSLRSVYRYYDDTDELVRAAIEHSMARNEDRFSIDPGAGTGSRKQRIDRFVAQRCTTFEAIAGLAAAATARARTDRRVRAGLQHRIDQLRAQHAAAFAPELDLQPTKTRRTDLDECLWMASGIEALTYLYDTAHHSGAGARRVMARALEAVLASS